ncbi:MAG TPA: hypothetical protein VLU73_12675 [Methylococcaceae bacterium]|nr:hypothetical protein [Methylococcaceae bacterium]
MTTQIEKRPIYLAVVMEGGLVQSIVSNTAIQDLDVLVIDYDTYDSTSRDLVSVPQADGSSAKAWSSFYAIEAATIDLAAVVHQLTEAQEAQP